CGAPAACWSYDGSDAAELFDPIRRARYSLSPHHYRPRCRSCQRRLAPRRAGQVLEAHLAVRAIRLYQAGAAVSGIAALMKTSRGAVRGALRPAGVETRAPGRAPRARTRTDHH